MKNYIKDLARWQCKDRNLKGGANWCVFSSVLLGIGFSLCYAIGQGGFSVNLQERYRKVLLV